MSTIGGGVHDHRIGVTRKASGLVIKERDFTRSPLGVRVNAELMQSRLSGGQVLHVRSHTSYILWPIVLASRR
jgi:hypothetical protein